MNERMSFEAFKNTQRHLLKLYGDTQYLAYINKSIAEMESLKWYPELLYLVAMADYICRVNNTELADLDKYRELSLDEPLFPPDVVVLASAFNDESIYKQALLDSIPEFRRFNIVEREVREIG